LFSVIPRQPAERAAVFAGPPVLMLPAAATTTSIPKDFRSAENGRNTSMAALDAPDGPVEGAERSVPGADLDDAPRGLPSAPAGAS